jgi:hypothetical protein
MAATATPNKIKRSFTITPESAEFLREARQEINAGSDSEALDLLLRELILQRKRKAIAKAYTDYYDTISETDLAGETAWAEWVGPNVLAGMDE